MLGFDTRTMHTYVLERRKRDRKEGGAAAETGNKRGGEKNDGRICIIIDAASFEMASLVYIPHICKLLRNGHVLFPRKREMGCSDGDGLPHAL